MLANYALLSPDLRYDRDQFLVLAIDENYTSYCLKHRLIPVIAYSEEQIDLLIQNAKLVILSGGVDIEPSRYGKDLQEDYHYNPERDQMELLMLEKALAYDKTVLGVCRGMQLINVYFGGSLIKDLPRDLGVSHIGSLAGQDCSSQDQDDIHQGLHQVDLAPNSWLADLNKCESALINSYHHQAIDRLGQGLRVAASHTSPAGIKVIEAIYHESLSIYGVQWHPERKPFNLEVMPLVF